MKTLREMMDLIEAAQRPHQSNTKNPVDFPRTWHDVDPKLGKQVDQMSQIEKVKKGFAHPDTLKKKGVAEGDVIKGPWSGMNKPEPDERYVIIRTKPDGTRDFAAGHFDSWQKAKQELQKFLKHELHTELGHQFEIVKKKGVAEEQVEESTPDALAKIEDLFRK